MTLLEKAKYIKSFQSARRSGKVKSRLCRSDASYVASMAELLRAVLGEYLQVWKYGSSYRMAGVAALRLPPEPRGLDNDPLGPFRAALGTTFRGGRNGVVVSVTPELVEQAVRALPVLSAIAANRTVPQVEEQVVTEMRPPDPRLRPTPTREVPTFRTEGERLFWEAMQQTIGTAERGV